MTLDWFSLLSLIGLGLFSGTIGALVGIGGGIVIVPVLVLAFGYPIKVAVATSLISVVATSTAAGSVYVGSGLTHLKLGMFLEIATALGGFLGGLLAVLISPHLLSALFAVMMGVTATLTLRSKDSKSTTTRTNDRSKPNNGFEGSYFDPFLKRNVHYGVEKLGLGSFISVFAGVISGLLGVGGGVIKVPAMNLAMKVPIKVAAATSNFMIGVTAVSSLFVYFERGFVVPMIATPVALGVSAGAIVGTRLSHRVSPVLLKKVLAAVLVVGALQMALKAGGIWYGHS